MKLCFRLLMLVSLLNGCKAVEKAEVRYGSNNLTYKWGKIALECTANNTALFRPRPTVTSRFLGLIWVSVFDAWSRYDTIAKPVYSRDIARRPEREHSLKNKEIAISFAAYRTMMRYYAHDSVMLTNKMKDFGFNPEDVSLDPATPVGIGNLAANAVIAARMNDGSNQKAP